MLKENLLKSHKQRLILAGVLLMVNHDICYCTEWLTYSYTYSIVSMLSKLLMDNFKDYYKTIPKND